MSYAILDTERKIVHWGGLCSFEKGPGQIKLMNLQTILKVVFGMQCMNKHDRERKLYTILNGKVCKGTVLARKCVLSYESIWEHNEVSFR